MAEMTQKKEGPLISLGSLKRFHFPALPEFSCIATDTHHTEQDSSSLTSHLQDGLLS